MNSLDLHGYTVEQASGKLSNFLYSFRYDSRDYEARIIVGSGSVIKQYVIMEIERQGLDWEYESSYNTGSIIVYK